MKRKSKLLVGLLFLFVLVGCLGVVMPVHGLVNIYSYNGASQVGHIDNAHPSDNASESAAAITFTAQSTGYLSSVDFEMYRGSFSGTGCLLVAELIEHTGTIDGQDARPSGDALDTSNVRSVSDISSFGSAWFTFTFNRNVSLVAGENYTIAVFSGGAGPWNGYLDLYPMMDGYMVSGGSIASTHSSGALYHNGGWSNTLASVFNFTFSVQVYGTETPATTPAPDATPTGVPTFPASTDLPITIDWFGGSLMWYIAALIIILVPCFILGVLLRFGTWGFIIGINIGAGLGWLVLPQVVPLWLVFVSVVGTVGMLMFGRR